jgi:hypothetical protein
MPQIPNFEVCEECFEDFVKPDVQRGSQLALGFGEPVFVNGYQCQLYSKHMRSILAQAAASGDVEFLRQRVEERLTAKQELSTKLQSMELQIRQHYEQAKYHDQMALMANSSALSHSLTVQIGTGNIPIVGTRYRSCRHNPWLTMEI